MKRDVVAPVRKAKIPIPAATRLELVDKSCCRVLFNILIATQPSRPLVSLFQPLVKSLIRMYFRVHEKIFQK